MTPRRQAILSVYLDRLRDGKQPPALKEIAKAVRLVSQGNIHGYVRQFVIAGYLRDCSPGHNRAYTLAPEGVLAAQGYVTVAWYTDPEVFVVVGRVNRYRLSLCSK